MRLVTALSLLVSPGLACAGSAQTLDLVGHPVGTASLVIFVIAYLAVMAEEFTKLRKSKPVILAAGLIWTLIGAVYTSRGLSDTAAAALRHNLLEYGELLLFLLAAMTYINAMEERHVFEALRGWLVRRSLSYRALFWATGTLAFFISPFADNLTTALIMCAVLLAVGGHHQRFITLGCINIVVAANAGGAFSPFGDITTLMVWQRGKVEFWTFFALFVPSVVNYVVPAVLMTFALPSGTPHGVTDRTHMKRGGGIIIGLFLLTIATAVAMHNFLHLPPFLGMMTGLAYLQFFGFYLKVTQHKERRPINGTNGEDIGNVVAFDIFRPIARAEWDTLLFFYGVILCVGGLAFLGYLSGVSTILYEQWGATSANVLIGVLSAIVDNIPLMFAVLTMDPHMSIGQWLLVTLTAGVGGSLLSIGSAAGVALMGQSRGMYTFFGHLKWTPAIALGYALSIIVHLWVNAELM
jgi:NhaD family Na+/H+ antiporter